VFLHGSQRPVAEPQTSQARLAVDLDFLDALTNIIVDL